MKTWRWWRTPAPANKLIRSASNDSSPVHIHHGRAAIFFYYKCLRNHLGPWSLFGRWTKTLTSELLSPDGGTEISSCDENMLLMARSVFKSSPIYSFNQGQFNHHLVALLGHFNEKGLLANRVEGQVHHVPDGFCYCCSVIFHLSWWWVGSTASSW